MPARTAEVSFTVFLVAQVLFLASCAKTGDPQPPQVLVPLPSTDLTARQYANRIVLTVAKPARNTNGSAAALPAALELFRAAEPDTGARGASPFTAESEPRIVIDAQHFGDRLRNGVFVLTDDPADAETEGTKALLYAVRFVNKKNQTAGFGNVVRVVPVPIPAPPEGFVAEGAQDRIALRWRKPDRNTDGSEPARIAGYNIYRSEDSKAFPSTPLNSSPVTTNEYSDTSFQFDRKYYYSISVVASKADPYAESAPSAPLEYDAKDTFPPSDPRDLNGVVEGGVVILLWVSPPEPDVAGYRVYRRLATESKDAGLAQELVRTLNYRDEHAEASKAWVYRVTAVDTHGNESRGTEVTVVLP
jgi:uncharacterized protein